jgi:glycosyltransferase involved in cell wall biosynthesis
MNISIITVTHNSASTIAHCLNSVSKQFYKPFEHIIIDGASTDNTVLIIKNHKSYFINVVSEPDSGIYDAMNKGIKIAKGDVIGFLNSDDFYADDFVLSRVVETLSSSAVDSCYGDLCYVDKKNITKVIRYWKSGIFNKDSFRSGWSPPHPTFFVRRSIYERYGVFNLNYLIAADIELMLRFLEINKISTFYISEILVKMRLGGVSNRNIYSVVKQNIEIIKALRFHNQKINIFNFCFKKTFSRFKQFIIR